MVEIPDSLRSVFSATVKEQNDTYVLEVPSGEFEHEALTRGETYRVAVLDAPRTTEQSTEPAERADESRRNGQRGPPEPPVEEGEIREVTIETVGDQGDGIAKVERGYVVIVPETQPGEQPTIRIDDVRQNVAFASVVDPDQRTL
jgi:predicted RNA-binding protein with TRAM domain